MPVSPTYPGVYIEELPSSVRPVVGVATSITAFVGYSPQGPEDVALRCSSFGEYERRFGGLDTESEMGFAVQQFFRNGGGEAVVVRVPKADAVRAGINLLDALPASSGTPKLALLLEARSTGTWGNALVVDVDHDGAPDTSSFNLTVTDLTTGTSERFAGLSVDPASPRNAVVRLGDRDSGSALVRATAGASGAGRPLATGTSGAAVGTPTIDPAKDYKLKVRPDVPTKPDPSDATKTVPALEPVEVTVLERGQRPPTSTAGWATLLQRAINAGLAGVSGAEGISARVLPTGDGGLRIVSDVDPAVAPSATDAAFLVTASTAASTTANAAGVLGLTGAEPNVGRYSASGGKRLAQGDLVVGTAGTTLPGTNQLVGSELDSTGLQALRKVDLFNLLSIPDATRSAPGDPDQLGAGLDLDVLLSAAYDLCRQRRAVLLVDAPPGVDDPDRAVDWIGNLGTKGPNAVALFPRLRIPDPTDDFRPRTVAPSGSVAGLYARTDATRGVWKAPAGTDARLLGLSGLDYRLTDAENGVLNPLGISCLRTFPVVGTVSWGARTTDGADVLASQWKYVPVRRLALYIEESVYRGTQWAVFEPNDEPLWSQLRLNLTSFMQDLFRRGAFAGRTPQEAYLVKCDAETTTRDDTDRGVVNVLVGFAPLKPAEFVVIRIQQLAGTPTT
jgi:phage tail sheath protein FI